MIYNLVEALRPWLVEAGLFRLLRVFTYIEFRTVLSIMLSFGLVVVCARPVIRQLIKLKIGDNPEFYQADLNELMKNKSNTPTMGGLLIMGAVLVVTLLLADITSFYIQMGVICVVWLTALGFADDYLKIMSKRRGDKTRDGLRSWEKFVFQLGLALLLGMFIHHYGQNKYIGDDASIGMMAQSLNIPFFKSWVPGSEPGTWLPSPNLIVLSGIPFVVLSIVVITGASNAVNLTDGMDGLASGIMTVVAFAFMVLALIAGYVSPSTHTALAQYLLVPYIPHSEELAIMAGAVVGACIGFLWYNCNPAQIFMGDTGSLPLGGLIGYIAVVIRQEFLLLIIGGVFVYEALSVILQVGYFKATGGKRIFLCAPVHHHYQKVGWSEPKIVVRFWVITAMLAAAALATIKLR